MTMKRWMGGCSIVAASLSLLGCPEPKGNELDPIESEPEQGATGTTTGEVEDPDEDEGDSSSDGGFILKPDGGIEFECNLFAQDCPDGEKCMPYANDGGVFWNATVCREIADDPGEVGDACLAEGGGTTGIDDCTLGAMCWDSDTETNVGTCIAMCEGDASNPLCADPKTTCVIANDGALSLCLPTCDPLIQDCAEGQACYPAGGEFACAPDASGTLGLTGETCAAVNACDPGLICVVADVVAGCEGDGCCTALCDVSDGAADAECEADGAGQGCEALYDQGEAPPGLATVGACLLPQ